MADTDLAIVAGALGGLAALVFVVLLVRSCHWHRVSSQRKRKRQDVVERFSLEFLSERLDQTLTMSRRSTSANASQSSTTPSSSYSKPRPSISETAVDLDRQSQSSPDDEYVVGDNGSVRYMNVRNPSSSTYENTDNSSSSQTLPNRKLTTVSEVRQGAPGGDSNASLEVNPLYRSSTSSGGSSRQAASSRAADVAIDLPDPSFHEPSTSAMQRPYALLSSDIHYQQPRRSTLSSQSDSTPCQEHYQHPRSSTITTTTSVSSAGGSSVSTMPANGYSLTPKNTRRPSGNDVFTDGVGKTDGKTNGFRSSPRLKQSPAQKRPTASRSSQLSATNDDGYTIMLSQNKSADDEYTVMLSPNKPSSDDEYTVMLSQNKTASMSSSSTDAGTPTAPIRTYQNLKNLSVTDESAV